MKKTHTKQPGLRVQLSAWCRDRSAAKMPGSVLEFKFFSSAFRQFVRLPALIQKTFTRPNPPMEDTPHHESWKDWFRQHGPRLLLYARQATRSVADAEDVLQEALVRFWRHQ